MKGNGSQIGAQIAQRNGARIGKINAPLLVSLFCVCVYVHVFKRLVFFLSQNSERFVVGFPGYVEVKCKMARTGGAEAVNGIYSQEVFLLFRYFRVGCGSF